MSPDDRADCDPRIVRTREAVLDSTLELLVERGYDGLAIEGVAERAGVAKTTIYRQWPTTELLVLEAVARLKDLPLVPDTGNVRDDLRTLMRGLAAGLRRSRWTNVLPTIIAASERHPELRRLHREFVRERQHPSRVVLERAIERGELAADADVELGVSLLAGPLFYRRLVTQTPLPAGFVDGVVDAVLAALGAPSAVAAPR
jgi:AcrR family transcriptional regulator